MKRPLRHFIALLSLFASSMVQSAPVTVPNYSYESPTLAAGGWSNALVSWTGSGGANNGQAFTEYIANFAAQGTQHLGMEPGYDVWQDLPGLTYQASTVYTLNVAVGNRSGTTNAGNSSVYGLTDNTGAFGASASRNASTNAAGTFVDGPTVVLDTYADPCVVGKPVRVLVQARGVGRSHFDNIRLDAAASDPAGRPAGTLQAASSITGNTATLNGTVTNTGSAAPSVIFHFDTSDKGGSPAAWTGSVSVPGTQSGAFSATAGGLQPATTYYYRARLTNASGSVWCAPCLSFTTLSSPPVVTNVPASGINGSSATIGANVSSTGGEAPNVTIYYGAVDGGTNAAAWASSVSIPALTGLATRSISGLTAGTTYYFRAYAQNGGGSDWADASASFTTLLVTAPAVENRAAENVTGTSAELRGEVTSTGNDPPVVTVYWGTADGGTNPAAWANSRVLGPDSGDFGTLVQGLSQFTTYFYTARAQNSAGTAWAVPGLSFTTGSALPDSVIINEVHYDPADVTKRQEFIEFHNPTAAPIDMSGWIIDQGVDFVFPAGPQSVIAAGGYKVVVENTAAFTAAFPAGGVPAGEWQAGGQLRNSGEIIRLKDSTGVVIDEVDYQPGFPWPTSAKGGGPSMELLHPSLVNDVGGNWRSALATGSQFTYVAASSGGWRYFPGTSEASNPVDAWRSETFVENTWTNATLPIGYGDIDGNAGNVDVTTTIAANQKTVFLRRVFNVAAGPLPNTVMLNLRCDDGCIAWINGVEITPRIRVADGAVPPYNAADGVAANVTEPPLAWEAPIFIDNAASILKTGINVLAVQLINTTTNSSDLFLDAELKTPPPAAASPGRANTTVAANSSVPPPAIRNVEHSPKQPAPGEDVVVSALITDPNTVGTVSLAWQVVSPGSYIRLQDAAYNNPASWVTAAMNDSGTGGDAVAGDGIFSATVPGSEQQHRRLIRYRITAADALANSVTVPYPDDEQPNFAWFCYSESPSWTGAFRPSAFAGFPATSPVTFPAALINSIEPYHLIALDSDVQLCMYTGPADSTPYRGTLVYEGKVYDHITFNIRGIGSTRVSGKNKLSFKFGRARDFRAKDNWGREYDSDWNSFGMDANASPWAAVHRGSAGVEDALSYRIFELGGMVSLRTHYVHFRIIRKAQESAAAGTSVSDPTVGGTVDGQYTSDLWGLYMALEPTEGNLLDERSLPDGNIYAIEGNNGDKKHQAASQVSDGTDWTTFRNQLAQAGQTEAWYRGNMDLDNLYTYIGLSRLVGNVDIRPGDNYRYYHSPLVRDPAYPGGHWRIMGYDHDMQFIAATHWGGTMDGQVVGGAPNSVVAMMRHANIARDYRNRCRELISLMGSDATAGGGQIGQLIDEYSQMINPAGQALTWSDLDAHLWNLHPRSAGGGGNTGQSSHRGNFFRGLYLDGTRGGLGGTVQTANYRRELLPGGVDGTADHEAIMTWFTNYATNTYPAATAWTRKATSAGTGAGGGGADASTIRQKGYGWKYLEWETLYGGYFNCNTNPTAGTAIGDLTAAGTTRYAINGDSLDQLSSGNFVLYPDKPVITYTGTPGYPVNDIVLHSSDYRDPQGDAISAVQFRVGEISAPGIPLYDPTQPRIYELEELWRSAEIPTTSPANIADVRVPGNVLRTGHTYRARVRHKDSTGRWSFWSEPLQFVASLPDVSIYANALRISEINYNPGDVTPAEIAHPGWDVLWDNEDFEFIELRNISGSPVDLTDVRFTKGIDFDFLPGTTIPSGGYAVLVKNPAAFAIRYPGVAIAGSYGADNLANGGEEVKLSYGAGAAIIEFTYDDNAPWPTTPDGSGPTLVLRTPSKPGLNHGDPAEWRASDAAYGTPGSSDGYNYNTWAAGYPGLGGKDSDDDKDGSANRLEYAFATHPQQAASNSLPTAQFADVSGQTYATLTFTRRLDAADTTFGVQFGRDLVVWNIPGVLLNSVNNGNGTLTQVWRSANPVSVEDRLYGRVLVTTNP